MTVWLLLNTSSVGLSPSGKTQVRLLQLPPNKRNPLENELSSILTVVSCLLLLGPATKRNQTPRSPSYTPHTAPSIESGVASVVDPEYENGRLPTETAPEHLSFGGISASWGTSTRSVSVRQENFSEALLSHAHCWENLKAPWQKLHYLISYQDQPCILLYSSVLAKLTDTVML